MIVKNKVIEAIRMGAFSLLLAGGLAVPARAHEAKCPHCELDLTQNTPEQDNEVVLKYGKKRIEYKCVLCAIADAEKSYTGDLLVLAPAETKGQAVEIARKGGQWSAPAGTVFVGHKVKHRYCDRGYRAFTSQAAFDAHVKKNKAILRDAKPLNLAQMVEVSKADIAAEKNGK
jgi:hypothetical protein